MERAGALHVYSLFKHEYERQLYLNIQFAPRSKHIPSQF
jgi:hypothetical protein